jgi:PD-(D/E)XK nuclease superfamily
LVDVLREREFFTPDLAKTQSDFELLGRFDVNDIGTEALLFQTGYLTIAKTQELIMGRVLYELSYPNIEVEVSLNSALLPALGVNRSFVMANYVRILNNLSRANFSDLEAYFKSLYASIPFEWYTKNNIANYEGHYASIFYSHFAALGLHVIVEDSCSTGKVDMVIEFNNTIFIFEFKVVANEATGAALQQIKQKNYAEKYRAQQKPLYLIGVEFSKTQRQIVGFEAELG